jgi:hypothetical protein
MYLVGYVRNYLGVEVHQPISRDRSLGIQEGSRGSKGDLIIRRFYIKLNCYLLDRSFVLNSNSILIYWYSFTSNELYFQV